MNGPAPTGCWSAVLSTIDFVDMIMPSRCGERVDELDARVVLVVEDDVHRVGRVERVVLDHRDRRELRARCVGLEPVDHGLTVERRAVGERHARPDPELDLVARRVDLPLRREPREQLTLDVAVHQRVVDEGGDDLVAVAVALRRCRRCR